MMHRYFLIEPSYTDLDTFCSITVGSGRVRANIQIYINDAMLEDVVWALTTPDLKNEYPPLDNIDFNCFNFLMSVAPANNENRIVRFIMCQSMIDDDAPFSADIRFRVEQNEATELAQSLQDWLQKKNYLFEWKP